ncbi:hypothetical protein YC2023_042979 [Brassica napus]
MTQSLGLDPYRFFPVSMDPTIFKLLEEDEGESMHSGADVDAFHAALNRDIEGSTSLPTNPGNVPFQLCLYLFPSLIRSLSLESIFRVCFHMAPCPSCHL